MFGFLLVPVVTVQLMFGSCPGPTYVDDLGVRRGYSCYEPATQRVYIAPYDRRHGFRYVFAHELGHAYDYQALTDADRTLLARWIPHRGPWRNPGEEYSAEERFADAYAYCETGTWELALPDRRVCRWLLRRARSPKAQAVLRNWMAWMAP